MKLPNSLWLELRLLVIIAAKRDQFRGKNSFLENLHIYVTTYGHMTTWQQFCLGKHVKFLPEWNFQDWKKTDIEDRTLGARSDFISCQYYVKFVVLIEIQKHKLCTVMLVELFCCARLQNHQWYQQTTSADSLLLGQGTRANKQSIAVDPTQKDLVNPS